MKRRSPIIPLYACLLDLIPTLLDVLLHVVRLQAVRVDAMDAMPLQRLTIRKANEAKSPEPESRTKHDKLH